jgi:hypothetical protein
MYFICTRHNFFAGNGILLRKGERVPNELPYYLCVRYEKFGFIKRVYDSIEEEEYLKTKLDSNPDFFIYEKAIEEYKEGKKNSKKGVGIKRLAKKFNITEYALTKALKAEGLV